MGFAQEDKVLLTINGEPVMLSEFLYIYEKNNQENSLEKKSMEEYLDLFINFKLKVTEAIAQGVDTTEAFKKEYPGIDINEIDKEIIDEWNGSDKSLVDIYNRIMLRKLMLDKAAESANEKNKNASTGSVSGISAPEKYYTDDEVRKMSDEEFSKNFRKILLQKKKEKEMNANG